MLEMKIFKPICYFSFKMYEILIALTLKQVQEFLKLFFNLNPIKISIFDKWDAG